MKYKTDALRSDLNQSEGEPQVAGVLALVREKSADLPRLAVVRKRQLMQKALGKGEKECCG